MTKKDEVLTLKRYEVRINLGDLFIQPIKGHYDASKRKSAPQPLKHWQFRVDEKTGKISINDQFWFESRL